LPWIWAVPVIALLIAAWLGIHSIADRGPVITIGFANAEGIEIGRNEAARATIRYKNVELGRVVGIGLSDDQSHVVVTAEMRQEAKPLLRADTKFWVVRPRLEFSGISGLSTLVSGSYIGILPGGGETGARDFVGLQNPPPGQGLVGGRSYTLTAERLPFVSDAAPVYYHGVKVGEVTEQVLSDKDGTVSIKIYIYEPHNVLIRPGSEFWVSAGVEASLGAQGLRLETETLQTLLTGAIVFDTPPAALAEAESPPGSSFTLYRDRKSAADSADPVRVFYQVSFPGALHGLAIGTSVELRGIPIGRVSALRLEYDPASDEVRVPATLEIAPHRIASPEIAAIPRDDKQAVTDATNRLFEHLIAKGLRARLAPDNLLIGSRIVALEFVENAEPARLGQKEPYPEFPALPGTGLDEIARSATAFLDQLASLPLGDLIGGMRDMVKHADAVVASPELKRSVKELDRTLADAGKFARDIRTQTGPLLGKLNSAADQLGSTLTLLGNDPRPSTDLARTMSELKDAARSVRVLADTLERHRGAAPRQTAGCLAVRFAALLGVGLRARRPAAPRRRASFMC
jgi:paraquat-inducible protein B